MAKKIRGGKKKHCSQAIMSSLLSDGGGGNWKKNRNCCRSRRRGVRKKIVLNKGKKGSIDVMYEKVTQAEGFQSRPVKERDWENFRKLRPLDWESPKLWEKSDQKK